jgi:predicted MFS family arabinose efflux permease
VFSFIIAFGITKALTNLAVGPLTGRFRRKQLLLADWALGIPVPFALAYAPDWWLIAAANVLLGVNQGLTCAAGPSMAFRRTDRAWRRRFHLVDRHEASGECVESGVWSGWPVVVQQA